MLKKEIHIGCAKIEVSCPKKVKKFYHFWVQLDKSIFQDFYGTKECFLGHPM